jgi:hypothetical protein
MNENEDKSALATKAVETTALAARDFQYDEQDRGDALDRGEIAIPYINLLQDKSPEIDEGHAKFIPGAVKGSFLNSLTRQVTPGPTGFHFVPVARDHAFVEWRPRASGGGIVGRIDPESAPVKTAIEKARAKAKATGNAKDAFNWLLENGNEVVETYYVFGLLLDSVDATEPSGFAVLALTGTKIREWKGVATRMSTRKGAPAFYTNRLRVFSKRATNKGNIAYMALQFEFAVQNSERLSAIPSTLKVGDAEVTHPLIEAGRALKKMVVSGEAAKHVDQTGAEGARAEAATEDESADEVFGKGPTPATKGA